MIKTLLNIGSGNITTYLLVAAVAGIGIYVYVQNSRIESLTTDLDNANASVVQLSGQVATQNATIKAIEKQYNETVQGTRQLNTELARLREETNEIEAQYNEYRGRLARLSAKKPGLVERLANTAFDDILRDFTQATDRENGSSEQPDIDTGTPGQNNQSEDQ